jgi:hypothetical protein
MVEWLKATCWDLVGSKWAALATWRRGRMALAVSRIDGSSGGWVGSAGEKLGGGLMGDVSKSCLLGPVTGDDALVVVEDSYCGCIKEGGASMVTQLAKGYKGAIALC